jgi:hypothetical protein
MRSHEVPIAFHKLAVHCAGLAIRANAISGIGYNSALAFAGEAVFLAFGNLAATDGVAAGAIAIEAGAGVPGVAPGQSHSVQLERTASLGAGSVAGRGPLTGYTALGLTGPQTSAGEILVGSATAPRQITNVAAGVDPTDAVNAAQPAGVAAQIGTRSSGAVLYDGALGDRVTLAVPAGTTIGNLAPGALTAASIEAVNGSQLFATNADVANLTTIVQNGSASPVRYFDPAAPAVPNGGCPPTMSRWWARQQARSACTMCARARSVPADRCGHGSSDHDPRDRRCGRTWRRLHL